MKTLTKRIRAEYALDRYDQKAGEDVCPGETNCGKFKIARRETGNGLDACSGCRLLPTKLEMLEEKKQGEVDRRFDRIISRAEGFMAVRAASGAPLDLDSITPLEFTALTFIEWITGKCERESQARMRIALEESLKINAGLQQTLGGMN